MNEAIIAKIDREIEAARKELAELTVKYVNIKSEQETPFPDAPFGLGVKKVLDTAISDGKTEGFFTKDYKVGVVSIAMKDGTPDLGIWVHGDVVPAGEGWSFEPYNAVEYDGRIVGRGAADNKGQLAAIFILLKIFKKMGIDLKYNPALYIGSNEETGMFDVIGCKDIPGAEGFINVATPPKLSLVPDGAFPIGYGGKGNMTVKLRANKPLCGITLTAGTSEAPGKATAVFADGNTVETFSPPVHTAHPDPNGNMITELSRTVLEKHQLPTYETRIFEFLEKASADTTGSMFGINVETETMTPLTLATYRIENSDSIPEVYVNIRFPIEITTEQICERIDKVASLYGFAISNVNIIHKPYLINPDTPLVKKLNSIANEITGSDKGPYTVGGGTYAHELPNAYVFGSSSNFRPESWDKGRGGAHGIDEVVSLDRLQRAMRIYARALLALNEIEW